MTPALVDALRERARKDRALAVAHFLRAVVLHAQGWHNEVPGALRCVRQYLEWGQEAAEAAADWLDLEYADDDR